jgi:hypothetical protein
MSCKYLFSSSLKSSVTDSGYSFLKFLDKMSIIAALWPSCNIQSQMICSSVLQPVTTFAFRRGYNVKYTQAYFKTGVACFHTVYWHEGTTIQFYLAEPWGRAIPVVFGVAFSTVPFGDLKLFLTVKKIVKAKKKKKGLGNAHPALCSTFL